MGWASGTQLMEELTDILNPLVEGVDSHIVDTQVIKLIESFEDQDWDCQNELLGRYAWWDRAYFLSHHYDHGYYFNLGDTVAKTIPRPKGKKGIEFDKGVRDSIEENQSSE